MNELTTVDFHGAKLVAVKGATPAETLVAMKPVVEGMGLDWEEQRRKLHRHPVLSPDLTFATVQMPGDDQRREWAFLPLTRVNFWLATVQPGRIHNEDVKAKVIEYQRECADVLFAHFFAKAGGELPAKPDEITRRIDGIARTTVHKVTAIEKVVTLMAHALEERDREIGELTDIVKGLVKCADSRFAAVDAIPALQVAVDAKVPVSGRRPIVRAISNSLARHCEAEGHVIRRDARGTKLYPLTAVHDWKRDGGDAEIRKLVAANTIIGPLFAICGGKV